MTPQELIETFELVDSWEDRYQFIIDLGKKLPSMPEELKVDSNRVLGCQSQVWIFAKPSAGTIHFYADSDAHIVRGLIAIVMIAFQDKTPEDILSFDIDALFNKIELHQHLSSGRGNGLKEMVKRVQSLARD